jgi:CxxC motif-containing protein (DUF1111 family)
LSVFAAALLLLAPGSPGDDAPLLRPGGDATIAAVGENAFGHPAPNLGRLERRAFAVGNSFFRDNWVLAPASAEGRDGLGPLFNATSCSGCHLRDGRAAPPEGERLEEPGLLIRLGLRREGGPDRPHPVYGEQVQDHAAPGFAPEARVVVRREVVRGSYGDGTPYELERPSYALEELAYGPLGEGVVLGPRIANQLVGLGLLEAIPEAALLAREDPLDEDGDGISGRAHRVTSRRTGRPALGRFGWKATQPTVEEQVAAAFLGDIGITSPLHPGEALRPAQAEGREVPSGGAPELDEHKLQRVTFYTQALAVPARRGPDLPVVRRGAELFRALRCDACHVPSWTTAEEASVPGYERQTIHPYTDLLLHDLGAGLADEKHDGEARPEEWRTAPLWGIGLVEAVSGHTRFLHDGRARGLAEAVLWHGGEAEASREGFRTLPAADREALLAFLRSI